MSKCIMCGEEMPEGYGLVCNMCESAIYKKPNFKIGDKVYIPELYNGVWFVNKKGYTITKISIGIAAIVYTVEDKYHISHTEQENVCFRDYNMCREWCKLGNGDK